MAGAASASTLRRSVDYPAVPDVGAVFAFENVPFSRESEQTSSSAWFYTAAPNDTFKALANHWGYLLADIKASNPTITKPFIKGGTVLLLPGPPRLGKAWGSDDAAELSTYFCGNSNGPPVFNQCAACNNRTCLVTHLDYFDIRLCQICWIKQTTSPHEGCCTICAAPPPMNAWNACEYCVPEFCAERLGVEEPHCTVILCDTCEKKFPFIKHKRLSFCRTHAKEEELDEDTPLNPLRTPSPPPNSMVCGKHNPGAYFWRASKQERNYLTEAETISQSIIYNELLLKKPTWDKDAADYLSLNKRSMTAWNRVRTRARDQEIIDHRARLKRSAKSTERREWKVVAEQYMARVHSPRSLSTLCECCFMCSQRKHIDSPCSEASNCLFPKESTRVKNLVFNWWLLCIMELDSDVTSGDAVRDRALSARFNRDLFELLGILSRSIISKANLIRVILCIKEYSCVDSGNMFILHSESQSLGESKSEVRARRSISTIVSMNPAMQTPESLDDTPTKKSKKKKPSSKHKHERASEQNAINAEHQHKRSRSQPSRFGFNDHHDSDDSRSTTSRQHGSSHTESGPPVQSDMLSVWAANGVPFSDWMTKEKDELANDLDTHPLLWQNVPLESKDMIIDSIRRNYSAMDLFSTTSTTMVSTWGWNEMFVTRFKTILFKPGNDIMEARVVKWLAQQ